ncbi:hypothetical protein JRI60_04825 [Archangium violaceum]|uniref:hypothetical protein n=1 Tax=Archangium violaceum TaxID=83451 RepID=UPI001950E425|nr:hypothetical protein [Archangium violaceum]QRN98390.1 hypothetical protein JRI60_04825 [Archangium violaceum]
MTAGKGANQVIEHLLDVELLKCVRESYESGDYRATEQRTADELLLVLDIYERLRGRIVRPERRG